MYRSIQFLSLTLVLLVAFSFVALGQTAVQFKIPFYITCSTPSYAGQVDTMYCGVSGDGPNPPGIIVDNTYGPDVSLTGAYKEAQAPPAPTAFYFYSTWKQIPGHTELPPLGIDPSGLKPLDARGYSSPTQIDTFVLNVLMKNAFTAGQPAAVTLTYPATLRQNCTKIALWKFNDDTGVFDILLDDDITSPGQTSVVDLNALKGKDLFYLLIKEGAKVPVPGPTIELAPAALAFGTVGTTTLPRPTQTITVTNGGVTNPLTVTGISSSLPEYTIVSPALPFTVAPGGSQAVVVQFAPTAGGPFNATLSFTDNAPASPQTYSVTGTGQSQGGVLEVTPIGTVLDNSYDAVNGYNTATIRLATYAGAPLKNIQFTLRTNGKIIMHKLTKAAAIAGWNLSQKVMRGDVLPDGSSVDVVNVLIWALNEDVLTAATPVDLLTFGYDVVNISTDAASTSVDLYNIIGATSTFIDANLNTSSTETIDISNRIQKGDVNGDDRVDIIDLLMIVDHITGKTILTGDAFDAANIASATAPWPAIDAVVNVVDLALLQHIIFTSQYPPFDGSNPLVKVVEPVVSGLAKNSAVTLAFHVVNDQVQVVLTNTVPVRGFQCELTNMQAAQKVGKDQDVTGAASAFKDGVLGIILKEADAIQAGSRIVATVPVTCRLPQDVEVQKLLVVNENLEVMEVTKEIKYVKAVDASKPAAFALVQNYPNPFNPTTRIKYAVKDPSQVRIAVYNILGQEVAVLVNEMQAPGNYKIDWNGMDANGRALSTGTYIYRMTAGNFVETKKMMFLK